MSDNPKEMPNIPMGPPPPPPPPVSDARLKRDIAKVGEVDDGIGLCWNMLGIGLQEQGRLSDVTIRIPSRPPRLFAAANAESMSRVCRTSILVNTIAHHRRHPHGFGRGSLFSVLAYWFSHGRTRCLACSPALVAIANNVLKAGRYSIGSLNARMLSGEILMNFQNYSCQIR
ncbi:MAG: hypothetical protein WAK55_20920 [Xanthobacteraceae bacterium]